MKGLNNIRQAFPVSIYFLFLAPAIGADIENVAIRLRITDTITQVPISGALVSLRKSDTQLDKLGASTNGVFNFAHPATTQLVQLRVEAENYTTRGVSLSLTNSHIEQGVTLDRTVGFRGFVIAPTGQTARGAQLALITKTIRMAIVSLDGRIETFNQLRTDVSDSDGEFNIGLDPDAESILVTHELGIGQVSLIGWTNETKVQLRAWTAVKGRMLINNEPAVNESIVASMVKFPH